MNIKLQQSRSTLIVATIVFLLLMSWFYFGTHWYPSATLLVSGQVSEVPAKIGIRWDSGHGLNGYEYSKYALQRLPESKGKDGIPLVITRTGKRGPAAIGKNVVLRNIYIDDRRYSISEDQLTEGMALRNGEIHFKEDGAELRLMIHPKSSLQLEFPSSNTAGIVDVQFGDKKERYDLYAPHHDKQWGGRYAKLVKMWFVNEDGDFTVSMPMPRYPITTLRVESKKKFSVSSPSIYTEENKSFGFEGFEYKKGFNFPMSEVSKKLQHRYHPHRLLFQTLFALLATALLTSLFAYARRFEGVKDILYNERRYLFWGMLITSCFLFFFWHISFWPGVLSNDSLEVWRAAQIPGMYLGDHPPLNVVFYLFLSLIWNDPAIVPLFQNLLTSLLIAYIFFSLFRKGLPLYVLVPCYLLVVFSIPVGLYSIILWKDIPFALITVFLGFKLAELHFQTKYLKEHVSWKNWFTLLCLTLALVGFRHNGVLNLIVVPFLVVLFGIVRVRFTLLVAIFCVAITGFSILFILPQGSSKTSDFLVSQTKTYLKPVMEKISLEYIEESGEKYFGIFNVNQEYMQWDLVHLCIKGRYANSFIKKVRWNDVYAYLPVSKNKIVREMRGLAWSIYWKSYETPWVYFSWNPFYLLALFPLLPLLFLRFPMSAIFSLFIFIPVCVLVILNIFNWRYYYFAYLASCFLVPMMATDYFVFKKRGVINA